MSDSCGHCTVAGKVATGICKGASNAGGLVGKLASGAACYGVGKAVTYACEKVSHCSTTKSAE